MTSTAQAASLAGLDAVLRQVSGERVTATVTALADDAFAGRRVGTSGAAAAQEWLIDALTSAGAAVTGDAFAVRNVPQVYVAPQVCWQHDGTTQTLAFAHDVAVHLASADMPDARIGGLAVAGYGNPAGRWMLIPASMSLFDAYAHADGAVGLLLGRGVDADGWHSMMLAGPNPGPLPVLSVQAGLHERMTATARHDTVLSAGTPIRRADVTGTNLYARYRDAASGGPELLLTAHYDGVGDHPRLRQLAAADNASGVVCEAARLLARALPEGIGLSVVLLDAEESGALGSAHHAAQLTAAGRRPVVINLDGAGHLNEAAAVEARRPAHGLLALLDQAGRHVGVPLCAGPVASDNRRYAAAGFAAVGIGAGMAGYCSPSDTGDRVKTSTLTAAVARLVVATAWLAATAPATLTS